MMSDIQHKWSPDWANHLDNEVSVAKALRDLPPPQGWIPEGPKDTIIESVFDCQWPAD